MAIESGDFKTGLTLNIDGDPWVVLDFQHVKPGKGAAILKTTMKNLRNGNVKNENYNANTKFEAAMIEKKKATYSYNDGATYYFMDVETYETYELSDAQVDDCKYYIIEGNEVSLQFFNGDLLNVGLSATVALTVAETTPAIKGAPSTQTKEATTNTGLTLKVPQFIEEGEEIMVSTTDGTYAGRA